MKRATVVAVAAVVLAALAAAAAADASIPPTPGGSVLGRRLPLKVYASVTPPVHQFATVITARVAVLADRKWVAPSNVHVAVHFAPYRPAGPPTVVRTSNGRLLQITWTWKLRCLTTKCIPVTRSSSISHIFHFRPAHIEYLSPRGTVRYALNARFQRVLALTQLSPSVVAAALDHRLIWQYNITPLPGPHYRLSPNLLFWLAVALACLLGATGVVLAARWALQFRPVPADRDALRTSSLERALTLFFWARAHDDETLQRKALERVADELPFDVHELSETARALAWSPETPEEDEVQEISERAGIHRRNGEPEQ
ncbi:MAG: hypothetical protein ACXVRI_06170 [Gaiellaceae bacterium]